jgi:hypothetical protein
MACVFLMSFRGEAWFQWDDEQACDGRTWRWKFLKENFASEGVRPRIVQGA